MHLTPFPPQNILNQSPVIRIFFLCLHRLGNPITPCFINLQGLPMASWKNSSSLVSNSKSSIPWTASDLTSASSLLITWSRHGFLVYYVCFLLAPFLLPPLLFPCPLFLPFPLPFSPPSIIIIILIFIGELSSLQMLPLILSSITTNCHFFRASIAHCSYPCDANVLMLNLEIVAHHFLLLDFECLEHRAHVLLTIISHNT